MHIILLAATDDRKKFLEMYAPYAMIFNLIFLILSNFTCIFGICITIIFREKAKQI